MKSISSTTYHTSPHSFLGLADSPSEVYNTNVTGTSNLLELAREFAPDARIHICSSSEVFGRVPKENVQLMRKQNFIQLVLTQSPKLAPT